MKLPLLSPPWRVRAAQRGNIRSILLPLICFALGLALSAVWFERAARPPQNRQPSPELSDSSKEVLNHLTQPVEIHFYSLLDQSEPASLAAYSQRVDQLLSEYRRQANEKITVVRFAEQTNADPNAALADGLTGFDFDKGQGSYLGMAFLCAGKKEVLPQLSPKWETALEADVARAIQNVAQAATSRPITSGATRPNAAIIQEVRQQLTNLDSVPVEEGIRTLREQSVKEFAAAAREMQGRVEEAQTRVVQAKQTGSAAEQDAAIKNLQALQSEQAQRLKQIAANSQARIEAFKQLKSTAK